MITYDGADVHNTTEYLVSRALASPDYHTGDGVWGAVVGRWVVTVDERTGTDTTRYKSEAIAHYALAELTLEWEGAALDCPTLTMAHVHICDLPPRVRIEASGDPNQPRYWLIAGGDRHAATVSEPIEDCEYCPDDCDY